MPLVSDRMLEYNALDSISTMIVNDGMDFSRIFEPAYDRTVRLFPALEFMMIRGIKVDEANLHKVQIELRSKLAVAEEALNVAIGRPFSALSPKQCAAYFYGERGFDPYYSRAAKGKPSTITTDDKAMQRLVRKGCKEAKMVQEIRGLRKLISNYIEVQYDSDGRFRSAYNPRGTKNGRLSSSKTVFGTGGNGQNLDPIFKQCLVADEGYVMVEIDKRQAEWVVMAYVTGDAAMISAVESGTDIHVATGMRMYDLSEAVIKHDHKIVGSSTDADIIRETRLEDPIIRQLLDAGYKFPRIMSVRQAAKKSNHGLNYDEGYRTFSLSNELPESEGNAIVESYHTIYPGIRLWYERIKAQLRKDRTLTNCFGRPRVFLGKLEDELYKAAYSYLPQSTVVDGLNEGLVGIYDEVQPAELLGQVHDSVLMQIPIKFIPDLYKIMRRVYTLASPDMTYGLRTFRIATDMKVGLNWGKASKTNPLGMVEIPFDNLEQVDQAAFDSYIQGLYRGWQEHKGLD